MFQGMEYVYEVYKEKSFSKAAQNLFISQPSLSANVRRVEERLGFAIFDRSTKPLGLTELGDKYIQSVEQIYSLENELSNYVNDWESLKLGNLMLGGSNLFASWILPALMGEFSQKYPQVKLVLMEERTAELQRLVLEGTLDLVIDYSLSEEEYLQKRRFCEEMLLLAVPAHFTVNREMQTYQIRPEWIRSGYFEQDEVAAVPLEAFREEPFVMLKPGNDTRRLGMKICQAYGFAPRVLLELDQQMTAYNVACSGMGITFIGDTIVKKVPENRNVIYYKLPAEMSRRGLYFYWKEGRYISKAMEEFLACACTIPG